MRRPTKNGADDNRRGGNNHGTLPATLVSPAPSASKNQEQSPIADQLHAVRPSNPEEELRPVRPGQACGEAPACAGGDTEADGIEADFQRKLTGLRRLPRHERALALRMARDARTVALRLLKQRRALKGEERRRLNQLNAPTPR